jgi:outer membrane biosynthesis protein TonB
MAVKRQFAVVLVALGLLLGAACEKQKPQLPPKTLAPTLPVLVADQIPEEEPPQQEPAQQQVATVEEPAPKKAPPKHKTPKKPTQTPPQNQASSTVAVNHPPASAVVETPANPSPPNPPMTDTAIAADVTRELIRQKQTTTELLDSTEKDLKGLNRSLSHDEEAMLTQIKSYVQQSRSATKDGDFERAYNLAVKAHLLSDALTKK